LFDKELIVQDAFEISSVHVSTGRRYIRDTPFAHFVWNLYHPEDRIVKYDGYIIHHKDEDILNK
jgi:hypothetical protein